MQLALIGRFYERIGDHAVNIGVRVEYMVTGWLPEHTGAARLHARQERVDANLAATLDLDRRGRRARSRAAPARTVPRPARTPGTDG